MAKDQQSRTRALLVSTTTEPNYSSYDPHPTFRITANPVSCNPDGTDIKNPSYSDYNPGPVRHGIPESALDDLQVSAFSMWTDLDGFRLIAWETVYHRPLTVELSRAQSMVKTLTRIGTTLNARQETDGLAESFGAYVARVAAAIGATLILIKRDTARNTWYTDGDYQTMSTGDGVRYINRLFADYIKTQEPAQQATA